MSATSPWALLDRAQRLCTDLRADQSPTPRALWSAFDDTVHRTLTGLLGPGGRHVPPGTRDTAQLTRIATSYPDPIRPPADVFTTRSRTSGVADAEQAVVFHRRLRVVNPVDPRPPTVPDLDMPDPTDSHPLARVTCALGAAADLLADREADPWTTAIGDRLTMTARVLAIGVVGARHALATGDLRHIGRPLAVAAWGEKCLDRIGDPHPDRTVADRLETVKEPVGSGLNQQLETARDFWTTAARREIHRAVPSADALRLLANVGANTLFVYDRLTASPVKNVTDVGQRLSEALTASARDLQNADRAWKGLTTLVQPSHEYLTASRTLHTTLHEVMRASAAPAPSLDGDLAVDELHRLIADVARLTAATATLPDRLLRSGLIFGPGKQYIDPLQRLQRHIPNFVPVASSNAPELQTAWDRAVQASGHAERAIERQPERASKPTHPRRGAPLAPSVIHSLST